MQTMQVVMNISPFFFYWIIAVYLLYKLSWSIAYSRKLFQQHESFKRKHYLRDLLLFVFFIISSEIAIFITACGLVVILWTRNGCQPSPILALFFLLFSCLCSFITYLSVKQGANKGTVEGELHKQEKELAKRLETVGFYPGDPQ